MKVNYKNVTELSGEEISSEQLQRLCNRYYWAAKHCLDKDVLEVACGAGSGLGLMSKVTKSLKAGDISNEILKLAHNHYKNRVDIRQFDACSTPFPDASFDVILIFEAIYYLDNFENFIKECIRLLRPQGQMLIVTANKDLYDFHPSPYSYKYYGVVELNHILKKHGFETFFYGETSVKKISIKQKFLRPLKKIASHFNLIPSTMEGKKLLKRIVFGKLVSMPAEIDENTGNYEPPVSINDGDPNDEFKVIYCLAELNINRKK